MILGELIDLRPIERGDTPLVVAWRNKPFVKSNFLWRGTLTAEAHEQWLREKVDAGRVVQFILCEKGGRPVGSVYLRDVDKTAGVAEYGIFIGEEDALGKGYGAEAARLMVEFAFQDLGLRRLFLRALAANAAAIKSYERAGFCPMPAPPDEASEMNGEAVLFMQIQRN